VLPYSSNSTAKPARNYCTCILLQPRIQAVPSRGLRTALTRTRSLAAPRAAQLPASLAFAFAARTPVQTQAMTYPHPHSRTRFSPNPNPNPNSNPQAQDALCFQHRSRRLKRGARTGSTGRILSRRFMISRTTPCPSACTASGRTHSFLVCVRA
jgi:hypothetical protein